MNSNMRRYCTKTYLPLFIAALLLGGCGNSVHDLAGWGELEKVQAMIAEDPALLEKRNDLGKTPLFYAVTYEEENVIEYLIEQGADVNAADDTGYRPLHVGAILDKRDAAAMLLDAGAEIDAKDDFGDTALHVAAYKNRPGYIELLVERGANVNAENNEGLTPLDLARDTFMDDAAAKLEELGGESGRDTAEAS